MFLFLLSERQLARPQQCLTKKDRTMIKRITILTALFVGVFAGVVSAQPTPPPNLPPPPQREVSVKLTEGEITATVQMINRCIAADPQGCAEAGVLMRKKFEEAAKPPVAAGAEPPKTPEPAKAEAGAAPPGGNRAPAKN